METRARRQKNYDNKDATSPAISSDVLRSLITAVTKAMTTTISNATVLDADTPKTIMYSSNIDPYNKDISEMKTKEGKFRWRIITKTTKG